MPDTPTDQREAQEKACPAFLDRESALNWMWDWLGHAGMG